MGFKGLVNHWTYLPEWRPGRRLWVFYLTFAGQPQLHALIRRYQDELRGFDRLDPVLTRWLHITVQGIAFTDQLPADAVDELQGAIAKVLPQSLPVLTVEPPRLDHDAISLQVRPTEEITALRKNIRDCVTRTIGGDNLYRLPEPQNGFNPHISVAYANAVIPQTDEICARLDRVPPPDIRIQVPYLSLLQLGREDSRWFWSEERKLAFGAEDTARHRATT